MDTAMAYASENLVEQCCTRYNSLKEAVESKKPPRTKYGLSSRKAKDVTLRPWQTTALRRVVGRDPKARNIHWWWGSLVRGNVANHPHDSFIAGNCCFLDKLVYNYH